MTTAADLRGLAREAFERSERAALMIDVQWLLKLRRVLNEAADELERPAMMRAQGAPVPDLAAQGSVAGRVVRGVYPMVSASQYEKDRGR